MRNQFLIMKELKEALPEIPENSLKRYLHEHQEYLNFKKEHNRYMIHVSEIEKLKLIRHYYSEGFKREEVNAKLEEHGFTLTMDTDQSILSLSVNDELADMKKLVSFLVQQNEQNRMQQNKIKDQNKQLIQEVQELTHTIQAMRELLQENYKREAKKVALLSENLLVTQKTVEEVVSSVETNKSKGSWRKWFSKDMLAAFYRQ